MSPPGTEFHYSNTNYVVLGLIVEAVSGRPIEQMIEEEILRPLRLDATSFPTTPGIPAPATHGAVEFIVRPGVRHHRGAAAERVRHTVGADNKVDLDSPPNQVLPSVLGILGQQASALPEPVPPATVTCAPSPEPTPQLTTAAPAQPLPVPRLALTG